MLRRQIIPLTGIVLAAVLLMAGGTDVCAQPKKNASSAAKEAKQEKPRPIRYIVEQNRRYVNLQDVAAFYNMLCGKTNTGPVIFSKQNRIDFLIGKRDGRINR